MESILLIEGHGTEIQIQMVLKWQKVQQASVDSLVYSASLLWCLGLTCRLKSVIILPDTVLWSGLVSVIHAQMLASYSILTASNQDRRWSKMLTYQYCKMLSVSNNAAFESEIHCTISGRIWNTSHDLFSHTYKDAQEELRHFKIISLCFSFFRLNCHSAGSPRPSDTSSKWLNTPKKKTTVAVWLRFDTRNHMHGFKLQNSLYTLSISLCVHTYQGCVLICAFQPLHWSHPQRGVTGSTTWEQNIRVGCSLFYLFCGWKLRWEL